MSLLAGRLVLIAIGSILPAVPAAATPWTESCDRFYELAKAAVPAAPGKPDLLAFADHYRRAEAIGFSGGAAVQQGERTLFNRGLGFADWETGLPMTPDTVFDIGSVSKQFTAAAILKLEEQGRLRVSDPITRFFPSVPADKRQITIHHLLTHSAGLPHDVRAAIDAPSRQALVEATMAAELKFAPGARYSYSNAGYTLLAAIVEIASGTGYETYLRRELWLPAGLRHTGWMQFDRRGLEVATGYSAFGATPTPVPENWIKDGPTWGRRGSGAILSTMNDLRRWATALRGGQVLSEESLRKMLRPYIREDSKEPSYYGYGWAISAAPDGSCAIGHNGSNNFHYNDLTFFPEKDLITHAVTLNSLGRTGRRAIGAATRVLLGIEKTPLPRPAALTAEEARQLAGVWRSEDGSEIRLHARGSRLILPAADPAVARHFTPFPPLPPEVEKRIALTRARLGKVIDELARGNYRPLFAVTNSPPEEEVRYWSETWPQWVRENGAYLGNELIATSLREDDWVTWILLKFERRNIVIAANYDVDGKILLGNSIFLPGEIELLPSEFVLTPVGKGKFRVLNSSFPGAVEVELDPQMRRMRVKCPRGETELVKAPEAGKAAA